MRQTVLATALLALLGAHISPPANFTPIPVANEPRDCGYDQQCLKSCRAEGKSNCEALCARVCN
jgi:hypothetical protein